MILFHVGSAEQRAYDYVLTMQQDHLAHCDACLRMLVEIVVAKGKGPTSDELFGSDSRPRGRVK